MDLLKAPFDLSPMRKAYVETLSAYFVEPREAHARSRQARPRVAFKGHRERLGLWSLPLQVKCSSRRDERQDDGQRDVPRKV